MEPQGLLKRAHAMIGRHWKIKDLSANSRIYFDLKEIPAASFPAQGSNCSLTAFNALFQLSSAITNISYRNHQQ